MSESLLRQQVHILTDTCKKVQANIEADGDPKESLRFLKLGLALGSCSNLAIEQIEKRGYDAAIKDVVARIRMHAAGANAPSDMASAVVAALEWVAVCIERGEAKGAGQ